MRPLLRVLSGPVLYLFCVLPAHAADQPQGWSGDVELGWVTTSGNSNTRTVNAKGKLHYVKGPWRDQVQAAVFKASDSGVVTAERYLLSGKSDYFYSRYNYLFATLRYVKDRFSGYDYQVSEVAGYGRRLIDDPALTFDLELGLGGRQSQETGVGRRRDVGIVRGAAKLGWDISATARFTEELTVESGSDNTTSESVTALKVKINGNFSMKSSVTVTNNSNVSPGIQHTDTITAVTLVYDF